jgi:hypothetical protein
MIGQDAGQCPRIALLFLVYKRFPYPAPVKAAQLRSSSGRRWRNILASVDSSSQLPETLGVLYTGFIIYQLVIQLLQMYCGGQSMYSILALAEW